MTDIKTEADWWSVVDANVENIIQCAKNVYGARIVGAKIDMFPHFVASRDIATVHDAIDAIWDDAPDDPIIHTWPGWGDICDLCSEYRVWED